jgi:hypothetical protein
MVRVTNDDELAEQEPSNADGGGEASLAWRSIAPQLRCSPSCGMSWRILLPRSAGSGS